MNKIKISTISYLNTKPFIYGLENHSIFKEIELIFDVPSAGAEKLIDRSVDIGIVPVASISEIPNAEIVSDFCIGASEAVRTVVLRGDTPIKDLKRIYLDGDSRSSNLLCKVLANRFWKIDPEYVRCDISNITLGEGEAAVLIGDKVFDYDNIFKYSCDLAEEWIKQTKTEFVFAAWIANRSLPEQFIVKFNEALKNGINSKIEVIDKFQEQFPSIDLERYYTREISYILNSSKRKGLELFLQYAKEL